MAATPAGRQAQQRRLERARECLDQRQARNRGKRASKRKPQQKVVVSPSDPEAALGRDKEGLYRPLYNVQVVDDLDSPLVLAYEVFAQPNDAGLLGPLLTDPSISFVKGFYHRPLTTGGCPEPDGGGRVTE